MYFVVWFEIYQTSMDYGGLSNSPLEENSGDIWWHYLLPRWLTIARKCQMGFSYVTGFTQT